MAAPFIDRPLARRPGPSARREGRSAPRQLQAAAVQLPTGTGEKVRKAWRKPQDWAEDAWDYFDTNPEMKFLVWWVGNLASVIDMFPAVELPDGSVVRIDALDPDAPETETTDEAGNTVTERAEVFLADQVISPAARQRALLEWARLSGATSAQSELQRDLAMNLEIAAECSLVGWAARPGQPADVRLGTKEVPATAETWEIRSIRELYQENDTWKVRDAPGAEGRTVEDQDDIIRLYQRHPAWKGIADCNMRAVIEECRLLQVLNGQMFAEHASKAAAGGFTWPTGLTMEAVAPTEDKGETPPAAPKSPQRKVLDDLVVALTDPGHDPLDVNSRVPFLIVGEPELLKPDVLRRIDFSRTTGVELDTRIEKRVERFAHGVNAPVEVVLGHRNTTFANAEQIDENEFDDFLQPRAVLWCDLLAEGFLRPQMANVPEVPTDENGIALPLPDGVAALQPAPADIAKVFVWYDASAIIGDPNLSEHADAALDRFAVSRVGYRKMKRIPEDYAPDPNEELTLFGLRRGIATAELTTPILKMINPAFQGPVAQPAEVGGEGTELDDDEGLALAASARAQVRAYLARQRVLAELGAEMLGLDAATLPALGMGADLGPPPRPRGE